MPWCEFFGPGFIAQKITKATKSRARRQAWKTIILKSLLRSLRYLLCKIMVCFYGHKKHEISFPRGGTVPRAYGRLRAFNRRAGFLCLFVAKKQFNHGLHRFARIQLLQMQYLFLFCASCAFLWLKTKPIKPLIFTNIH